jgi:hypothetical protein
MEKPVLKKSDLEIQGRVATITFRRDDVRNAFLEKRPGMYSGS